MCLRKQTATGTSTFSQGKETKWILPKNLALARWPSLGLIAGQRRETKRGKDRLNNVQWGRPFHQGHFLPFPMLRYLFL